MQPTMLIYSLYDDLNIESLLPIMISYPNEFLSFSFTVDY